MRCRQEHGEWFFLAKKTAHLGVRMEPSDYEAFCKFAEEDAREPAALARKIVLDWMSQRKAAANQKREPQPKNGAAP